MAPAATSIDGTAIAFETQGSELPALVLVHGWSCDRSYWEGQYAPLSAHAQVVVVDLAGHGDSDTARHHFTIASFGEDVAAVVRALDVESVILVGHSMGGDVILEAARQIRDRVRGLVWVDTYDQLEHLQTAERVRERMAPFREDFVNATRAFVRKLFPLSADATLVDRVATDMSSAPLHVALGALEAAMNHGRRVPGLLQQLGLPLVAINPGTPATDVSSLRRHGIEVTLIPGVGHFPMMEAPLEFNRRLLAAVEKLSPSCHHGSESMPDAAVDANTAPKRRPEV